ELPVDDVLRGADDEVDLLARQLTELPVRERRALLEDAERPDHGPAPVESIHADREIPALALGLRAPQVICRDLDIAEGIFLDAEPDVRSAIHSGFLRNGTRAATAPRPPGRAAGRGSSSARLRRAAPRNRPRSRSPGPPRGRRAVGATAGRTGPFEPGSSRRAPGPPPASFHRSPGAPPTRPRRVRPPGRCRRCCTGRSESSGRRTSRGRSATRW